MDVELNLESCEDEALAFDARIEKLEREILEAKSILSSLSQNDEDLF